MAQVPHHKDFSLQKRTERVFFRVCPRLTRGHNKAQQPIGEDEGGVLVAPLVMVYGHIKC